MNDNSDVSLEMLYHPWIKHGINTFKSEQNVIFVSNWLD